MYVAQTCPMCKKVSMCVRDHGTWVGYFCKSCGHGGSKTANKKDACLVSFKFSPKGRANYKKSYVV